MTSDPATIQDTSVLMDIDPPVRLLVCVDCGHEVFNIFMVTDEIWAEAGYQKLDMAHAVCLAVRLGRALRPKDFTYCPANDVADSMRKDFAKHTYNHYLDEYRKERER